MPYSDFSICYRAGKNEQDEVEVYIQLYRKP